MKTEVIEEFVTSFDHHDPRLGEDPHAVYAEMRERCPVTWTDKHGGYWVISGYPEAHHVLQHYEQFTTYPSVSVPAFHRERPMLPLEVDPPIHGKYRSLLAPVFAPPRINALEDQIRASCTELIDAFIDRGSCDFVGEFAIPLPVRLFVTMMGLPTEEIPRFTGWKDDILHGMHKDPSVPKQATAALEAYTLELLEDRKRNPKDDILSTLIASEVEGERLSDQEILDINYLLFLAGLDTVTSALSLQFLWLAEHTGDRDRLVEEPSVIPDAIEEMLRFEALIIGARTVVDDIDIFGVQMKKGQRLVVNMVAANRDERQFPHAEQPDFDREQNRHIAFGAGPHRCVGSHLARLELRVATEEFHRRIPTYRLAPDAVVHRHADNVAGIDALPLVWDR